MMMQPQQQPIMQQQQQQPPPVAPIATIDPPTVAPGSLYPSLQAVVQPQQPQQQPASQQPQQPLQLVRQCQRCLVHIKYVDSVKGPTLVKCHQCSHVNTF